MVKRNRGAAKLVCAAEMADIKGVQTQHVTERTSVWDPRHSVPRGTVPAP